MCGQLMVAQQPAIKRLDSSTITTAEIDATIVRLMRAAEVTGVGVAIINDGKVVISGLTEFGTRKRINHSPRTRL